MIKKAAPIVSLRACACMCLPVRFYFASSSHSTVSYLSGFLFFCLLRLFGVGVSEFLSMSVFYT